VLFFLLLLCGFSIPDLMGRSGTALSWPRLQSMIESTWTQVILPIGSMTITALVNAIAATSERVAWIQSSKGMKYDVLRRPLKSEIEYSIASAKIRVVIKDIAKAARIV